MRCGLESLRLSISRVLAHARLWSRGQRMRVLHVWLSGLHTVILLRAVMIRVLRRAVVLAAVDRGRVGGVGIVGLMCRGTRT